MHMYTWRIYTYIPHTARPRDWGPSGSLRPMKSRAARGLAGRFGRGFVKHNNNSGFVDHDEHRSTPQAFSAYSFSASEGDVLVCDVQGVDDLYTDPQLHSVDESRGEGDLGRRGRA